MYHSNMLGCKGNIQRREYNMGVPKGKTRTYEVVNSNLSTKQAQNVVDMLVESVFKQMFNTNEQ